MPQSERMYRDLAWLWPLISQPEEYAEEATYWRKILRDHLGPGKHTLLELGVGGGHNLSHIAGTHGDATYRAAGVDLSSHMLDHARRLIPDAEFHTGDMRSVRLGRTFDGVLIHDAASYLLSEEDLRRTFATARAHLRQGGVLICTPDWFRETFRPPVVSRDHASDGITELTMIATEFDPDPSDTRMEVQFTFEITEDGVTRVEEDRHVLGLFSIETWLHCMAGEGFRVRREPYPVHPQGFDLWLLVGVAE